MNGPESTPLEREATPSSFTRAKAQQDADVSDSALQRPVTGARPGEVPGETEGQTLKEEGTKLSPEEAKAIQAKALEILRQDPSDQARALLEKAEDPRLRTPEAMHGDV